MLENIKDFGLGTPLLPGSKSRMRKKEGWARGQQSLSVKTLHPTETLTSKSKTESVLGEDEPPAEGLMTPDGESRKEATQPMTILLSRATLNIRTWNVRTMYKAGKTAQVAKELRAYCLDVLGISE